MDSLGALALSAGVQFSVVDGCAGAYGGVCVSPLLMAPIANRRLVGDGSSRSPWALSGGV
jgi:hypothetical protein